MWPGADKPILYPPPERQEYRGDGVASRQRDPPVADDSFLRVVDRRVSVRSFKDDPVSDDALTNCLRVARLAPSAGNLQAYQVVVVRNRDQREAVARAALHQTWIADAPAILVFLADPDRSGRKYRERGRYLYAVQDATIAAAYTQLALEAAGLSSCWVGAFHEEAVASAVGASYFPPTPLFSEVPLSQQRGTLRPVVVMPVGVAAERHRRSHRRPTKKFVHHGYVGSGTIEELIPSSSLPEPGTKRRRDSANAASTQE